LQRGPITWRRIGHFHTFDSFVLAIYMHTDPADYIRNAIRSVPDWPKPGIVFRDITPVLQDPRSFRVLIDLFVYRYMRQRLDLVAGIDARGFILGSVLAYELNLGFVPVRKKGKLPYRTVAEEYSLEYGNASVEMHTDSVRPGQRVLLIDDLIATGGTMMAASKLLQRLGANVVEAAAIIELPDLGGSAALRETGLELYTVCSFSTAAS
jgi:adenine phosphoribosyltransferase